MPCCLGIGIGFVEARGMIKKAKGGDVQTALLIADTIGFEVQMASQPTSVEDDGEGDVDSDGFDFM